MKKLLFVIVILLLLGIGTSFYLWTIRTSVASYLLRRELKVPVQIRSLEVETRHTAIEGIWIGNPRGSRTSTSFSAQTMDIIASFEEIRGNPLVIEEIDIANIFVGLEFYNSSETNWSRILNAGREKKRKKEKDYLIRKLVLTNLTVEVMQADGTIKRYPTIPRMEFYNISSETGFPVSEIEKAIFDLMMKDLFRKLQLDQLIRTIDPLNNIPNFPFFK